MRVSRLTRWLVLCLTAALLGCQAQLPGGQRVTGSGVVAWPKDGDLWTVSLADKKQTRITQLPTGANAAAATGVAWSPDGSQLVYSRFGRRASERVSGADLMLVGADGSNERVLVERDEAATILENPIWVAPDRLYYGIRKIAAGRELLEVVRRPVSGGAVESLVQDGYYADVSPDEQSLVYLRTGRTGVSIIRRAVSGGTECTLIPDTMFFAVWSPRISPDGQTIAFSASGDQQNTNAGTCEPVAQAKPLDLLGLLAWIGVIPRTAYAHGPPWDIWLMNVDGSNLRRLTDLDEDEPTLAWSPDGKQIAVFGVRALVLLDATNGQESMLVEGGNYGAIDWRS
jgi:Tol biopolymer transport system component